MTQDEPKNIPAEELSVCPICGGTGYVRLNVPVGHRLFGKAVPCRCKREQFAARRQARLRRASNIEQLQHMSFDTFRTPERARGEIIRSLEEAKAIALEFARQPSGWLLLSGPYGCGKTHLAAAIANHRIERGDSALFVVVPDLLDYLRGAYAPSSPSTYDERFMEIRDSEVLILDDLGTQNSTAWATEKLYQLLNYRYNMSLPTVITTNQSLSDTEPRLASRLLDQRLVRVVPIYAPDFRSSGRDESFGSLGLYSAMTFERFTERRTELDANQWRSLHQALKMVLDYAETPTNWLLLRGGFGVGKTHLAAAAANRLAQRGTNVLFVVASDLLDHLRATFQPGSPVSYDQRFSKIRRAWLLVLDDLGAQNTTPWAQEKLFQILNYRYLAGLPTILTVAAHEWDSLDERLKSRLLDTSVCKLIDINVPSYRGSAPAKETKQSTRRRM